MLPFDEHQWKVFHQIRRNHKVSLEFLQYNLPNILKFITHGLRLRIVLKSFASRRRNRVVLKYQRLRRYTFDDDLMRANQRKRAKRRTRILKQWSQGMVQHLRKVIGVKEFEEVLPKRKTPPAKDVINEMKKQLELLKAGKRSKQLIEDAPAGGGENNAGNGVECQTGNTVENLDANDNEQELVLNEKTGFWETNSGPVVIDLDTSIEEEEEAQKQQQHNEKEQDLKKRENKLNEEMSTEAEEKVEDQDNTIDKHNQPPSSTQEKTETQLQQTARIEPQQKEVAPKRTANILDVLMKKVFAAPKPSETENRDDIAKEKPKELEKINNENEKVTAELAKLSELDSEIEASPKKDASFVSVMETDPDADSSEEFLGFADDERPPGMLKTPLVRFGCEQNPAFISRSLDDYFRDNALDTSVDVAQLTKLSINRKVRQTNIEGLMTTNCAPPPLAMPALPESLSKLRTVAERRQYLSKNSKSSKLAIINNEAYIYRELQRKIRQPRIRCATQQALQTSTSAQIAFTRQGWQAASFINTELNKYFYQKVIVKDKNEEKCLNLRGVCGNNTDKFKPKYSSRVPSGVKLKCSRNCVDCYIAPCLRPLETFASKKKLYNRTLRPLFKPCPLSEKPKHQLLDKEAAPSGDMVVARLPAVELAVSPETGKTFNDIVKRYLQFITPYDSITREWAEFSTSTLQLPKNSKKNEKPAQRKTYVFTIPYANDRSQILVRRIIHHEETIDAYFRNTSVELPRWAGLSFREHINEADKVAVECADVLTDMINSVAISCCEDSFMLDDDDVKLKNDEDAAKAKTESTKCKSKQPIKVPPAHKISPQHNKNARLFNELRRLNATIIDTQNQAKEADHQCREEFCALGCVCISLANGKGSNQQHCGKLKCMFHCRCNGSSNSHIVRVESDGRSITTEDAVMIRRQATARLARMEKEFTSTIVVTENETLLINESAYEKRRRVARVPKRYDDFRHADDDFTRLSPVKSSSGGGGGGLSESNEFRSPSTAHSDRSFYEQREQDPVMVEDVVLQKLKHCSVPLVPFDDIQNMATFCLVHQVYKCFCGGHATEGKRLIIEKENLNNPKLESSELLLRSPATSYSFEKSEERLPSSSVSVSPRSVHSTDLRNAAIMPPQTPKTHKNTNSERSVLKRSHAKATNAESVDLLADFVVASPSKLAKVTPQQDIMSAYLAKIPRQGCSRFVPVPSRTYRSRNRQQVEEVWKFIRASEDRASQLLLNEHIMRSVYYHKEMVKAEKAALAKKQTLQANICGTLTLKRRSSALAVPMPMAKQPKVEIEPNEEEDSMDGADHNISLSQSSQQSSQASTILSKRYILKESDVAAAAISEESESVSGVSVNEEETSSSTAKGDENAVRDNFNEVIKTLNGLVSRKMHDIDNALKRDSKQVPPPTEDILCVLRWRNFAEAYRDHCIYVWEVKMKNRHFLAATITNIIPIVPGALGVMNILAVPSARLPLIGRMLMLPFTYNEAVSLAVIMQGRSQYWYIKGFLEPNGAKACLRPTPETHAALSLKINTLCSSLVKQRAREQERMSILQKQRREKQQQQQQQAAVKRAQSEMLKPPQTQPPQLPPPPLQPSLPDRLITETKMKQYHLNMLKQGIKSSNIAIRRVTQADVAVLKPPQVYRTDHRWYVLDWAPDFSHIFMPELKELISYEHISRLQEMAALKKTVHRMEFHEKNHFAAYFVPDSMQKIYFGPLQREQPAPILVLMQKVNGEMMPREVYEKMRLLKPHAKATTAFWMTQINGKMCFHEAIPVARAKNEAATTSATTPMATKPPDDDEDDCVIIDDHQQQQQQEMGAASKSNADLQKSNVEAATPTTSTSSATNNKPLMNFTIQTSAKTNALKISTADGFELCHTDANKQPNNAKEAESKLKILSVFNLPPVSSSSSAKTQTQTLKANQQPPTANTANATTAVSSSSFQHEFNRVATKQNTNSKLQIVRTLKPAPVHAPPKLGTIINTTTRPNTQQLGGYKLVITSAAASNSNTTTTPTTPPISIQSSETSTSAHQPQTQTATTKLTNVPVGTTKAVPFAKLVTNASTATTTQSAAGNTFSIPKLQRPITIRRIEALPKVGSTTQTITSSSSAVTAPVKRLSSGIIKLPGGVIRAMKPVISSNVQPGSSANVPAGIKITKTTPTVYPVNIATATDAPKQLPPQQQQPQQNADVTKFNLVSTASKPVIPNAVSSGFTFRFIHPKPAASVAFNRGIETTQPRPTYAATLAAAATQSTSQSTKVDTPPAAKIVSNATTFLAKKTSLPSNFVRQNQFQSTNSNNMKSRVLAQKKYLHQGEMNDLKRTPPTPTPSQFKRPQQSSMQKQQHLQKLQQKLQLKSTKVATNLPATSSSDEADVILIDD